MKWTLLTDIDLCYGCFACETACKQEHNLPADTNWIKVVQAGPKIVGGRLTMDFVPMHCRHCEKPSCVEACPENAISRRSDGIVLLNEELCIGCEQCVEACPFGARQLNPEKGVVQGCNLCYERVDQGLPPICVQNCPTEALVFGDPKTLPDRLKKKQAQTIFQRRFIHEE